MASGWLAKSAKNLNKPKESVIEALIKNMAGFEIGRQRTTLHASDVTKPDFCPRREAFLDLDDKQCGECSYVDAALRATFDVGKATELLIVEKWGGDKVIGNWKCRICDMQVSMCPKPNIPCASHVHDWEYLQWEAISQQYTISGSVDSLWDLGTPLWMMCELKIMAPQEFEKIIAPLPEHRLRTNLYMKLIGDSESPYRDRVNLHEARVLYTSRGHGKKNEVFGKILPWKEFIVERNDDDLKDVLNRSEQLAIFRKSGEMPSGICSTAIDKVAQKCSNCTRCFSGNFPAKQPQLLCNQLQ